MRKLPSLLPIGSMNARRPAEAGRSYALLRSADSHEAAQNRSQGTRITGTPAVCAASMRCGVCLDGGSKSRNYLPRI